MNNTAANRNWIFIVIGAILVALVGYWVMTMPDRRTGSERVGDAISELPNGVGKAADQLQDRTPGEKLGDAVEDAGESIKRNTDR